MIKCHYVSAATRCLIKSTKIVLQIRPHHNHRLREYVGIVRMFEIAPANIFPRANICYTLCIVQRSNSHIICCRQAKLLVKWYAIPYISMLLLWILSGALMLVYPNQLNSQRAQTISAEMETN